MCSFSTRNCPRRRRKNRHVEHVQQNDSNDEEAQNDRGKERHEEIEVVCPADAVVEPDAVVVKVADAFVAAAAVLRIASHAALADEAVVVLDHAIAAVQFNVLAD